MFDTRQKCGIANIILQFTCKFMQKGDFILQAIIGKIFESELQIPFTEESISSIPKIGPMQAVRELSSLNAAQKDKFYEIIDTLQKAIELNPYYSEDVKDEVRAYMKMFIVGIQMPSGFGLF